jgi:hypothetical protein
MPMRKREEKRKCGNARQSTPYLNPGAGLGRHMAQRKSTVEGNLLRLLLPPIELVRRWRAIVGRIRLLLVSILRFRTCSTTLLPFGCRLTRLSVWADHGRAENNRASGRS